MIEPSGDRRGGTSGAPSEGAPSPATETPNVARIYDYLLGGSHNFPVDRQRAEELIAHYPNMTATAWANRSFLRAAVEHALALGIRQFLDLGSGIPTVGNVHEIAHRRDPAARIAYVDNEAVAVAHATTVLAGSQYVTMTDGDLRYPETVLAAPGVAGLLDFDQPVAVLAVAALHWVPDDDEPAVIVAGYRRVLAVGSMFAMTHSSADYPDHPQMARARDEATRLYASTSNPIHDRSRAQIRSLVEPAGFTINADGLVDISRWATGQPPDDPLGLYALITDPLTPGQL